MHIHMHILMDSQENVDKLRAQNVTICTSRNPPSFEFQPSETIALSSGSAQHKRHASEQTAVQGP